MLTIMNLKNGYNWPPNNITKMRKDYLPGFPHINVDCQPNRWSIFPIKPAKIKI